VAPLGPFNDFINIKNIKELCRNMTFTKYHDNCEFGKFVLHFITSLSTVTNENTSSKCKKQFLLRNDKDEKKLIFTL